MNAVLLAANKNATDVFKYLVENVRGTDVLQKDQVSISIKNSCCSTHACAWNEIEWNDNSSSYRSE
jgi:hypothetical protein